MPKYASLSPRPARPPTPADPHPAQLAQITTARFGLPNELCILLPSEKTAEGCRDFLASRNPPVASRIVKFPVHSAATTVPSDPNSAALQRTVTVYASFFPADDFSVAKQYWQHTGDGISSRVAERCLTLLGVVEGEEPAIVAEQPVVPIVSNTSKGARYTTKNKQLARSGTSTPVPLAAVAAILPSSKLRYAPAKLPSRRPSGSDDSEPSSLSNSFELPARNGTPNGSGLPRIEQDEDVLARYVEERYGRNLDLSLASLAKLAMRRRIAGVMREAPGQAVPVERIERQQAEDSDRGVAELKDSGVWLYPTGMSSIFHAHQLVMGARREELGEVGRSVCFGCVCWAASGSYGDVER